MTVVIRPAQADDIATLAAFARRTYAAAFGASLSAADLAEHLRVRLSDAYFAEVFGRDAFLLAVDGGLIGFAQFGDARMGNAAPGDRQLLRLYVDPERQNAGTGSALLHAVFGHERLKGAARLFLDVWGENRGARRLYERFGFRVAGKMPFTTPSGTVIGHDLLMVRALP